MITKTINIDKRLLAVAEMVDTCDVIADVGTDHGYLPIYLILENKVKRAYASDVAKGPLNKAIENINNYGLQGVISPLLSDGLDKIPTDVNCVIMAGMGGNLIAHLIEKRRYDYSCMVLQPNIHVDILRKAIIANNYTIVDETVSYVNKKYYEIIKIKPGKQELDEKEIKFGPINLINRNHFFIEKWQAEYVKYLHIISNFKGSQEEYNRLINEAKFIKEMLDN